MTRKECLDEAAKCVLRDRQNEYGQPGDCFGVIAGMWTAYLGKCVSAHDVAAMMVLLKVARFRANPMHADSAVDCAGYASLMAELATAWEREGDEDKNGDAPAFEHGDSVDALVPDAGAGGDGFKDGDPVEVLPIDGEWERAAYRYSGTRNGMRGCWVSDPDSFQNLRFVPDCGIRPVQTPKAEGNHPENPDSSPEFRPGDRVQAFNGEEWVDCRYIRWKEPEGRHVVQYEGCMCSIDPEMLRPGELGVCGRKARFKSGDKVQYRVTLPSVSDRIWVDAVYACLLPDGRSHAVKTEKLGLVSVEDEDIRPAPRAEGCEELVRQDAPLAPEKECRPVMNARPSSGGQGGCQRGRAHTPTGEELAEMTEEEVHG